MRRLLPFHCRTFRKRRFQGDENQAEMATINIAVTAAPSPSAGCPDPASAWIMLATIGICRHRSASA